MNITIEETISCIRADAKRYPSGWRSSSGFWVTLSYRIRRLRKYGGKSLLVLLPLDFLLGFIRWLVSDSAIPSAVAIGPGFYLPHPNGIVINHMATIGRDVAVFQQVTVAEWHGAAAAIGDSSALYAGAKIVGGISIGRRCKIGANVVVNADVPDDTSVSWGAPIFRARTTN